MSKESSIKAWLSHPNRTMKKGLELFQQHSTNINLMRHMKRLNDDNRVISILDTQLRKLIGLSVLPEQVDIVREKKEDKPKKDLARGIVMVNSVEPKKRTTPDPYTEVGSRPKLLIPVYDSKNNLYVEAKNLSSLLVAKGDEMDNYDEGSEDWQKIADERHEMAKQILSKYDLVNESWNQIDYYSEHGKLPDPVDPIKEPVVLADKDDPIAMDKRWRTLGTYISKAKKDPEKNQNKLVKYYNESNEIANKLNAIHGEEKYIIRNYETPAKAKSKD
jgi:hypothetical protein